MGFFSRRETVEDDLDRSARLLNSLDTGELPQTAFEEVLFDAVQLDPRNPNPSGHSYPRKG